MYGKTLLSFALGVLASSTTLVNAASVCNGHAELCYRLYSNVTFLGAHDSYAVGQSIADNQDKDVTAQLNDGIRTLQFQAHNASDGIHLCHSSCSLVDAGLMSDYLSKVATWVQANPTQVISLLMVNINTLPVSEFASAFEAAGLSNYVYSPSSASTSLSDWPTLGSLVDSGKTVVAFMDYNADFASVPYIIDEFSNMWEDAYDVTTTTWECAVNRTAGTSSSMMMLVNHFLDTTYNFGSTSFLVPDKAQINTTNSDASLGLHVGNCNSIWGRAPNHILLDFYDSNGNEPFDFVAQLNGVPDPTNTVTPYSATATGTSSTPGATEAVTSNTKNSASSRLSTNGALWVLRWSAGIVGVSVCGGLLSSFTSY